MGSPSECPEAITQVSLRGKEEALWYTEFHPSKGDESDGEGYNRDGFLTMPITDGCPPKVVGKDPRVAEL